MNLNDRLASYIERVRNLETENQQLHIHLRDIEDSQPQRRKALGVYETRVAELLRKQLESITREKTRYVGSSVSEVG